MEQNQETASVQEQNPVAPAAKKSPSGTAVLAIVIMSMVIGSFTTTFTKMVMNMGVASETVSLYRMVIVSICLFPLCIVNQQYRGEMRKAFSSRSIAAKMFVLGLCKMLGIVLCAWGIRHVPIIVYNTVWNMNPVFTIIFAYLILKERVNPKSLIGVAICLIGVLVVGSGEIFGAMGTDNFGAMVTGVSLAAISSVSYAVYLIVSRLLRSGFSMVPLMFVLFTIASVLQFIVCLFSGVSLALPLKALPLLFVLSMLCTLMTQSIPVWALKFMSPTLYSLINLGSIVLSACNAFLLLGEVPSLSTIIGSSILITGLFIYLKTKDRK